MKDAFEQFMEIGRKGIEYDPWVEDTGIEGYCKEIMKEVKELTEAVEKQDYANMKEELGDVFMDWLNICLLAEKDGIFSVKEVINDVRKKVERRKPYLLENKKVTRKKALEIWYKAKEKEKIESETPL